MLVFTMERLLSQHKKTLPELLNGDVKVFSSDLGCDGGVVWWYGGFGVKEGNEKVKGTKGKKEEERKGHLSVIIPKSTYIFSLFFKFGRKIKSSFALYSYFKKYPHLNYLCKN